MLLKRLPTLASSTLKVFDTTKCKYRSLNFAKDRRYSNLSLLSLTSVEIPLACGHFYESRRCAGHSHWQNVRHIKAAKDANKMSRTDKFVRLIEVAVKMGGSPDPKLNKQLANTIEAAKRTQVVTNAAIETAIRRASGAEKPKNLKQNQYEIIMEHGVLILADVETGNISKFGSDLKRICKGYTCRTVRGGVKEKFQEKGYVKVTGREDGSVLDPDAALEVGIEHGAEDVVELGDGEDKICEFLCDSNDYFNLSKALSVNGYVVSDCGIKFVPHVPVTVTEEHIAVVGRFCDELEEHPEVIAVHTNIA